MALIAWTNAMSVGIAKIDREHQGLIDLINKLSSEMAAGKGADVLGVVLSKLVAYTKTHFAGEEVMLRTHGYPNLATQQKEHAVFTQKMVGMLDDLNSGKNVLGSPVVSFLGDWLRNHILKQDMAYKPFMEAKGVK